jgi:hypothetical protein
MRRLELLTPSGDYNWDTYLLADENSVSIKVAKYSGTDRIVVTSYGGLVSGMTKEDFFAGYSKPRNRILV